MTNWSRWGRLTFVVLLAGLLAGCDQTTKRIAADRLMYAPPQSFLNDLFRLQYAENRGAFLGLGAGLPDEVRAWLMIGGLGMAMLGMLAVGVFRYRLRPQSLIGLALIVGGGASNWLDRLLLGNVVVDFMNVGVGPLRSGVFNFADLFIEGGLALILVDQLRHRKDASTRPQTDVTA